MTLIYQIANPAPEDRTESNSHTAATFDPAQAARWARAGKQVVYRHYHAERMETVGEVKHQSGHGPLSAQELRAAGIAPPWYNDPAKTLDDLARACERGEDVTVTLSADTARTLLRHWRAYEEYDHMLLGNPAWQNPSTAVMLAELLKIAARATGADIARERERRSA